MKTLLEVGDKVRVILYEGDVRYVGTVSKVDRDSTLFPLCVEIAGKDYPVAIKEVIVI